MLFVFMSQPDFACNPHALWKYIKENTKHEVAWILKRKNRYLDLRARGIRCALYNTIVGRKLVEEADYVITNSYTFLELPKRDGQVFVNLWHGSGIKAHDFYNHDMNPRHARKLHDFFEKIDLMCVHSLDDRFRLSAQLHYDMRKCYVTGQPRLDCVTKSNGKEKLCCLYGDKILSYDHIIFFAPSFRANMSTHSGTFMSDNIFRLEDYDDTALYEFLEETNSALIYKLHPIEQTAFSGREFQMNERCFELNDNMLFDCDIRYTELLNAFDVMMSDYSSIAYDYLLLDRPIIYLIPDYEEYNKARGFVFHNIDYYMPGDKVYFFDDMLKAMDDALNRPQKYAVERKNVMRQRFDFCDDKSAQRCYELIKDYVKITDEFEIYSSDPRTKMPSASELIRRYLPDGIGVIDATLKDNDYTYVKDMCEKNKEVLYITHEIPDEYRRLSGQCSTDIGDLDFYYKLSSLPNVRVEQIGGGVDYKLFSEASVENTKLLKRIGFAGTIDNRIYFAMVQSICESFPEYEIVFAGDIFGDYPVWLKGYDNLKYIEASYGELPAIIQTFDVAILPFFGRHKDTIPTELFQYLAAGKNVVASDMPNLPECAAIYTSKSISDAVEQVKKALEEKQNKQNIEDAKRVAFSHDWKKIAKDLV